MVFLSIRPNYLSIRISGVYNPFRSSKHANKKLWKCIKGKISKSEGLLHPFSIDIRVEKLPAGHAIQVVIFDAMEILLDTLVIVILPLDIQNAFNTVTWDKSLDAQAEKDIKKEPTKIFPKINRGPVAF